MKRPITIHRTRFGSDIIAEFAAPSGKSRTRSKKVAILAAGMPSLPGKHKVIEFLAKQGFWVVSPRYRGTWESGGEFLVCEPTKDIDDVIKRLSYPAASYWMGEKYQFPKDPEIYIFASSFGGPAGILLSKHPQVKIVVVLSPIVDWGVRSEAEPLDWMYSLIKNAYGNAFRMSKRNWQKLGKGAFYNPMRQLDRVDGSKILLFHAEDDQVAPFSAVKHFSEKAGATFIKKKSGGHFSLSLLEKPYFWRRILLFERKKQA